MEFFYFRVEEFFVYGGDEMAENLLKFAFPRAGEETVADKLNEIESYSANADAELEIFIQELENVKTEVEKREEDFYKKLKVNNYTELKGRLMEISHNYDFLLANRGVIQKIKKDFDFSKVTQRASVEEIAAAVEEALNQHIETEGRNVVNKAIAEIEGKSLRGNHGDALSEYVQKTFKLIEQSSNTNKRFVTSRGGQKVGLGKLIIGYDMRTGKPKLSTEGVVFSSGFVKKLENLLSKLSEQRGTTIDAFSLTRERFKEEVDRYILESATGETRKLLQRVITEGTATKQFDLNRSIASVTGYCGEVRATAILLQITGDLTTRGTGSLRSDLTGAEIPIDVVCMANGFQIKNYTLNGKSVTFNNTLSALSWVEGRLRLTGKLRDILVNLFGIYQFNQPFSTNGEKQINYNPEDVEKYKNEYYNRIYGNGDGLFYRFKDVFDARVPTMLKMYEGFSVAGDTDFSLHQMYFNTFFWINQYLVPSSVILDGLIKQLRKKKGAQMISTKYTLYEPDKKQSFQKNPNLIGQSTMSAMAKKLKMEYEIEIELPKFV